MLNSNGESPPDHPTLSAIRPQGPCVSCVKVISMFFAFRTSQSFFFSTSLAPLRFIRYICRYIYRHSGLLFTALHLNYLVCNLCTSFLSQYTSVSKRPPRPFRHIQYLSLNKRQTNSKNNLILVTEKLSYSFQTITPVSSVRLEETSRRAPSCYLTLTLLCRCQFSVILKAPS